MSAVAKHVMISGMVQGVGFRWATLREARRLGVVGWVRNLPDGRVEVHLEGEASGVEAMLDWLRAGPPTSRVDDVAMQAASVTNATSFEISG